MGFDGYQRVPSAGACPYCRSLANRGPVYSLDAVDTDAHDHCKCTSEVTGDYQVGDIPATAADAVQIIDDRELARLAWLDIGNPFRSAPPPRFDPWGGEPPPPDA